MDSDDKKNDALNEDQVVAFLRNNPTFFRNHDDLLLEMRLPHESGKAISLLERQVNVLRERNMDMRHRLNKLLDNARDNDKLFDKTRRLVLSILEVDTVDDIVDKVIESLQNDFQVDASSLILFGTSANFPHANCRRVDAGEARKHIGSVIKNNRAVCGILRTDELAFLFPKQHEQIGSAAIVPLAFHNPVGVLAIGSFDPHHYRSSMGTLFLTYIAEVLNRTLPR